MQSQHPAVAAWQASNAWYTTDGEAGPGPEWPLVEPWLLKLPGNRTYTVTDTETPGHANYESGAPLAKWDGTPGPGEDAGYGSVAPIIGHIGYVVAVNGSVGASGVCFFIVAQQG